MYWIHERNLEGLMSIYADDAVLESTAVLVLEGHTRWSPYRQRSIDQALCFVLCHVASEAVTGVVSPRSRIQRQRCIDLEYPSQVPSGAQFDVVESMPLRDGLIGQSPRLLGMAKR